MDWTIQVLKDMTCRKKIFFHQQGKTKLEWTPQVLQDRSIVLYEVHSHPTAWCYFTGNEVVDSVFTVLLSTNMFVGGVIGFVLDNTIPGTHLQHCCYQGWAFSGFLQQVSIARQWAIEWIFFWVEYPEIEASRAIETAKMETLNPEVLQFWADSDFYPQKSGL